MEREEEKKKSLLKERRKTKSDHECFTGRYLVLPSCAALVVLSFLSTVTSMPTALCQVWAVVRLSSSKQARECDCNSITMIPAVINEAGGNISICSAHADKALLSLQVLEITPNVGVLR